MPEQRECATCGNSRTAYEGLLCVGDIQAKPVEAVRHFRGRCGIEGRLWVPIRAVAKGKAK